MIDVLFAMTQAVIQRQYISASFPHLWRNVATKNNLD